MEINLSQIVTNQQILTKKIGWGRIEQKINKNMSNGVLVD